MQEFLCLGLTQVFKIFKTLIMKNFKIILFSVFIITTNSCNLDEDPIFLDETLYDSPQSAIAALNGIYESLTSYGAQEQRIFVVNGYSGMFTTGKQGNRVNNINNNTLFSLKPVYDRDSESMWGALYTSIARCNTAIANIATVATPSSADETTLNDIAGHAYFVRAWSYFSLVRLFGDIPLWLTLPNSENLNKAKSPAKEVYEQIILDAKMAGSLMNGDRGIGYPKQYAANMLLAKVYMTLATNTSLQDGSTSDMGYWQMAYDEAKKVYGNYTLHSNYSELFTLQGENSSESIFELQVSQDAANSQMGRNYTPWKFKAGQHFGWLRVSADFFNEHVNTYPNDPRIEGTYLSEYSRADNGNPVRVYPANASRSRFAIAHPYLFKFAVKDKTHSNQYDSKNVIVYRYSDVLIMLAEISNELGNGEQLGYVSEVLNRVGLTPHAGYLGSQEDFRDAIMNEYRFELLGEGEDSHNNRRRGYNYFLNNTILKHNTNPIFKASVDLRLGTDESQVMQLPIPLIEINTNELIN